MKNILKYNYLVIGGGSGGLASARYVGKNFNNKKVALIEHKELGGTCVNVGCVPKKLTYNLSNFLEESEIMKSYGIDAKNLVFDYSIFKKNRDSFIKKLNQNYEKLLKNNNVDFFKGYAHFIDNNTIQVGNDFLKADNILIATGSKPFKDKKIEGMEFCLDSDDFFKLDFIPESVVVVGGGYIALELIHLLKTMGAREAKLIVRSKILKFLDNDVIKIVEQNLKLHEIDQINNVELKSIRRLGKKLFEVELTNGEKLQTEMVLMATGRVPNIDALNLENTDLKLGKSQQILVDEFDQTNVKNIFSIGDVTKRVDLTPVAIKAGRILGQRIFGKNKNLKMNYDNIPTVVFTHPPVAYIGLNTKNAQEKFGDKNINIFSANLTPLFFSLMENSEKKEKGIIKLICVKNQNDKIVGIQAVGKFVDEILQGFAVAINLGATKADFNDTLAIHPTVAEDFVLIDYELKDN